MAAVAGLLWFFSGKSLPEILDRNSKQSLTHDDLMVIKRLVREYSPRGTEIRLPDSTALRGSQELVAVMQALITGDRKVARDKALAVLQTHDRTLLAPAANMAAFAFLMDGILDSAACYFSMSAEAAAAAGDSTGLANAEGNLGLVAMVTGHLPDAYVSTLQAASIDSALRDTLSWRGRLHNLTQIQLRLGERDAALATARRVIGMHTGPYKGASLPSAWTALAAALCAVGETDSGEVYVRMALDSLQKYPDKITEAYGLVGWGAMLHERGATDSALQCLHSALSIFRVNQSWRGEASALQQLAQVRLDQREYVAAGTLLVATVDKAMKYGMLPSLARSARLLGQLLGEVGDHPAAVHWLAYACYELRRMELPDEWMAAWLELANVCGHCDDSTVHAVLSVTLGPEARTDRLMDELGAYQRWVADLGLKPGTSATIETLCSGETLYFRVDEQGRHAQLALVEWLRP